MPQKYCRISGLVEMTQKYCKINYVKIHNLKLQKRWFLSIFILFVVEPVLAQQSQEEHESHHPDIYSEQVSTDTVVNTPTIANTPTKPNTDGMGPGMAKGKGSGMAKGIGAGIAKGMGSGIAKGMDKMMEKMGAPKPKDLYPSLMRLSRLPPEKEQEVLDKALARMLKGNQLMMEGFVDLSEADGRQNFSKMQQAIATIEQGLSQYDSGLAAKRAIVEGQEPRRVALQWFKSEMNLLPTTVDSSKPTLILGMSPFHTSVMFILLIFAGVMVWMYAFKMRRAASLLRELESLGTTPTAAPAAPAPKSTHPIETVSEAKENSASVNTPNTDSLPVASPISQKMGKPFTGQMKIVGIFKETHDVKTIRLASPMGGTIPFDYEPGQFVTFSLTIPGQPKVVKRSYTIASSPTQRDYFEVTIKREEFGVVSRFMHDVVLMGDLLNIKAPSGKFFFNGKGESSIVLISGGVGITPMMSAVRYLTSNCWEGEIYFLFSARSSNDFIFEQELKYLQARHKNLHVLVSMTQAEGTSWMGPQGRFTPQLINGFVPDLPSKTAHICGPPPMMDAMKSMLADLGMAKDRIKIEGFGGTPPKKEQAPPIKKEQAPPVKIEGVEAENGFEVNFVASHKKGIAIVGESILDLADTLDIDIDNSCRAGSCGSCKVKLIKGSVDMEIDDALEDDEKEQGYILACQSIPTTSVEVEA